ncbi:holo-[acyl-carrier-protein] synthase [Geobacter sp. SVR]|uniref:holo-[acyl-carrier-protein] synthase n=1 Tax=Geobacter sp. SVR TaxID=2495594 RepID=UPI00143EF6C8|nr:holo-[acyl-carrier-protein] synthase [Geobacter sp. SVR]BCS54510.1 holo-[acyl-carrier-protein] synthase [Geobacter sp. SVR]GCF87110.1 holo-[acyl-carrier-protein] synthase [Geobacter sp. SVR]
MIFGIGTDIVSIERFQRFIDSGNTAILRRLFTPGEQAVCTARKSSAACYAARFAAKESFLKAIGTGLRDGISWLDMEVVSNDLGKPELLLSGEALNLYRAHRLGRLFLSLSHDGGCAVAMVVVEAE